MEKPIVFKNKRGKQLMGILHLPEGKRKWPLVIICSGFGGTKTSIKKIRLARLLEKNKIASFRFDFEGCGDSEGNFEKIIVKRQVSDLEAAMEWVLKQKNVDKNKIALVGSSLGAVIVALFVAQTKFPAKTLVFWSQAFDQEKLLPHWYTKNDLRKWRKQGCFIRKEEKIGISYLKENVKRDYSPILSNISIPILIIHGQKDDRVPIKFSRQLAKDYENIKLTELPKADHKFENYYIQKRLIQDTVRWLKNFL